jgi:hypothetical protein
LHINCAIIKRLRLCRVDKSLSKALNPTTGDFRNLTKALPDLFDITPLVLAQFGLRKGSEGFLESGAVPSEGVKDEPADSVDLYDASPPRTYSGKKHNPPTVPASVEGTPASLVPIKLTHTSTAKQDKVQYIYQRCSNVSSIHTVVLVGSLYSWEKPDLDQVYYSDMLKVYSVHN